MKKRMKALFKGIFPSRDSDRLEKEIQSIIDAGEEEGLIDPQSGEMIQSILEFRETVVREIMIPRTQIVAVPVNAPIEEIIEMVSRHGHTRMPVYRGNIDNIVGILNVKDLLKFWSRPVTEADIEGLLRKPYYIPETQNTHVLLHNLKARKYHMAIVIDEYGGTAGLVTLEDLIEEIVGDLPDEHDGQEPQFTDLPNGGVLVDGRVEIEKIEERFGVEFAEGKFETLGGLILSTIGRIPTTGEVLEIEPFEMTIEEADDRSIKKVKIRKKEEEREE
ncbi:MAG TPA: hemolysin family protein [Syntrophales bacterium]|nr:hemolysin family protein [Syntrophales bacterium]HOM06665.1 hemolysin family protein [Syntrophales bacterium]HOO00147.1 hemolysin family protein [Syntrophales bacterium]HPC01920.1 hemolysin family protein [Syntrophales bacterium]HPQ06326.1 hemolysin family protein [Syntrophales bacterium]